MSNQEPVYDNFLDLIVAKAGKGLMIAAGILFAVGAAAGAFVLWLANQTS